MSTPEAMLARLVWRAKHRLDEFYALDDDAPADEEGQAYSTFKDALEAVFEQVEALPQYDEEKTT